MPQKLVAPKRLKLEKVARLTLQEIRYMKEFLSISKRIQTNVELLQLMHYP